MTGASAQVTEAELTSPLEGTLSRLKGVQSISSRTTANNTHISIDVDKWTDIDLFRFHASALLRQLYPKLPEGASYPQVRISREQKGSMALMTYTLNGPGTANEITLEAENRIRPIIASLKGVDRFEIVGAVPIQLVLREKDEVMRSIGLSHQELRQVLSNSFAAQDIGVIVTDAGNINLSINNIIHKKEELGRYPVANSNGRIFTLSDVATLHEEEIAPTSFYRINGDNLVNMSLYAERQVNSLKLAEEVKAAMDLAVKKLPEGYELKLSYNSSDMIKEELNKIYIRTFLSVALLLGFMLLITRQARYMFIIIASLLVNVFTSFIFYYLFGLEIHLYSLAGITISLGLVIDNAIVVIEDIRHTGRNRIFVAILASTLISLGALSVIFFLPESQKNNLIDFAIAIIINLLISLPVAYFFIPAFLEKMPVVIRNQHVLERRKRQLIKLKSLFEKQLGFMLRYRLCFFLLFALSFGIPTFLLPRKIDESKIGSTLYNYTLGSDFYQQTLRSTIDKYFGGALFLYTNRTTRLDYNNKEEQTQLRVNISMPKGSTLLQMNEIVIPFELYLKKFNKEIEVFTSSVSSPTQASISILIHKLYDKSFPQQLKHRLETMAIHAGAADFSIYGVGIGFNNAIELDRFDSSLSLTGYNYNQLQRIAFQVSDTLKQNPRVGNILISTSSAREEKPYYEYVLQLKNTEPLTLNRINRSKIGAMLQEDQSSQIMIGNILSAGDTDLPVVLVQRHNEIPTLWETNNAPLTIGDSTYLRLANLSQSERIRMSESIVRRDQSYQLNVHYQFIGSGELNHMVKAEITKNIQHILPYGYRISSDNTMFWGAESNGYLWFIPLVLFIIFMISAVLLESLKQALVIVLMIPFSFIGVFLCFYFLGLTFDQGGYASLLMLAGLVTNASLYIINDLNFLLKTQKRKKNVNIRLFIKAFNAKAMPILVTTASAILSLLPFMLSGEEKGFWFTLSAGTIGGLIFSLIAVYLFLPLCLIPKK